MRLADATAAFLDTVRGSLAPGTVHFYNFALSKLCKRFGDETPLEDMTITHLRTWMAEIRGTMSDTSVTHCGRAVKRFWSWIADENMGQDIARRLQKPKYKIVPKPGIGEREMRRMLQAAKRTSPRDYALMLFVADTGCRKGGVAGLTIGDLDLLHRTAYVTEKGDKRRAVFFSQITAEALREYLGGRISSNEHDGVFIGLGGKPLSATGIYRMFRKVADLAEVKDHWNPHEWRHAVARGMLKKGANLAQVSQILGHKDIRVTVMYYGIFSHQDLKRTHDEYHIVPNDLD